MRRIDRSGSLPRSTAILDSAGREAQRAGTLISRPAQTYLEFVEVATNEVDRRLETS